jgi:hypothetical protein
LINLFKSSQIRVNITEVRFWSANLPQSIIKENLRQPLAMLYEQKRAIKIKIRKRNAGNET